jgi:hypothetical protein
VSQLATNIPTRGQQANKDKPAIVSLNIGTTVKGAVDSLAEVRDQHTCYPLLLETYLFTPVA